MSIEALEGAWLAFQARRPIRQRGEPEWPRTYEPGLAGAPAEYRARRRLWAREELFPPVFRAPDPLERVVADLVYDSAYWDMPVERRALQDPVSPLLPAASGEEGNFTHFVHTDHHAAVRAYVAIP